MLDLFLYQNLAVIGGGYALAPLTLAWSTAASDNTPGFSVSGASLDVAPVGAQIELQVADDVNFTPPPNDTELSAVTGNPTTVAVDPALSDGQYWARARLLDSGDAPLTDWSNVVTETIVTTVPFSVENCGVTGNATNGTTSTFTGHDIGTPSTGRILQIDAACHSSGNSPGLSGLTVNGNAATLSGTVAKDANMATGTFYYALDAGETAEIIVSWDSVTVARAAIAVRAIHGSSGTPTDTFSQTSTGATTRTISIDVPADGVALGFEYHANVNANAWSGTDTIEHTAAVTVEAASSASSAYNAVAGAPKSLVSTWTTSAHNAQTGAAWSP